MKNRIFNKEEIKLLCISLKKFPKFFKKFCSKCICYPSITPGVVLKTFYISATPGERCLDTAAPNVLAYFVGEGDLPDVGDFVYIDEEMTPLTMGIDEWYSMAIESSELPILGSLITEETGEVISLNCK